MKFFCDVINIEVRYFQITSKFDIFKFFQFPQLQDFRNFVPSAKDRKNHEKKNDETKVLDQNTQSSTFLNNGRNSHESVNVVFINSISNLADLHVRQDVWSMVWS